jgi:hypothetical protein
MLMLGPLRQEPIKYRIFGPGEPHKPWRQVRNGLPPGPNIETLRFKGLVTGPLVNLLTKARYGNAIQNQSNRPVVRPMNMVKRQFG